MLYMGGGGEREGGLAWGGSSEECVEAKFFKVLLNFKPGFRRVFWAETSACPKKMNFYSNSPESTNF